MIPAIQNNTDVEERDKNNEALQKKIEIEDEKEECEREMRLESVELRMKAKTKKNIEEKKEKLQSEDSSTLSEHIQESVGPRSLSTQTDVSDKFGGESNRVIDGAVLPLADRRKNIEKEMKIRSSSQNENQTISMDLGSLIPEFSAAPAHQKNEIRQQYLNKSFSDLGSVDSARTNNQSDVLDFNNLQSARRKNEREKGMEISDIEEISNSSEKIIRRTSVTPLKLKSQKKSESDRDNIILPSSRSTSSFKRRILSRSESNLKMDLESEVESKVSVRSVSSAKSAHPSFPLHRAVSLPFEAWKQGPKTVPSDPYIPNSNESLEFVIVRAINLPENCTVSRYSPALT